MTRRSSRALLWDRSDNFRDDPYKSVGVRADPSRVQHLVRFPATPKILDS